MTEAEFLDNAAWHWNDDETRGERDPINGSQFEVFKTSSGHWQWRVSKGTFDKPEDAKRELWKHCQERLKQINEEIGPASTNPPF